MFVGVELGDSPIDAVDGVLSPSACRTRCEANSDCAAWNFHVNGTQKSECWLLRSPMGSVRNEAAVSGVRFPKPGWDACQPPHDGYAFCDVSLPLERRLDDLLDHIPMSSYGKLLTARQSVALPEIGLPAYYWGTNAIHGLRNVECLPSRRCPTSFPTPNALGATFNTTLIEAMGEAIGRELRGYHNSHAHNSLNVWSPTVSINRDARWGRNDEVASECPYVAGEYGAAYTRGVQRTAADGRTRLGTATLKHFVESSVEGVRVPSPLRLKTFRKWW